jgi:hypothetical protein
MKTQSGFLYGGPRLSAVYRGIRLCIRIVLGTVIWYTAACGQDAALGSGDPEMTNRSETVFFAQADSAQETGQERRGRRPKQIEPQDRDPATRTGEGGSEESGSRSGTETESNRRDRSRGPKTQAAEIGSDWSTVETWEAGETLLRVVAEIARSALRRNADFSNPFGRFPYDNEPEGYGRSGFGRVQAFVSPSNDGNGGTTLLAKGRIHPIAGFSLCVVRWQDQLMKHRFGFRANLVKTLWINRAWICDVEGGIHGTGSNIGPDIGLNAVVFPARPFVLEARVGFGVFPNRFSGDWRIAAGVVFDRMQITAGTRWMDWSGTGIQAGEVGVTFWM